MIDRRTAVINAGLRCTRQFFIDTLAGTPAAAEAGLMWDKCAAYNVDPLFFLAFFWNESNFGVKGICAKYGTRSPGNTRSSLIGQTEFITDPDQGRYMKYRTWELGALDAVYRLVDPGYVYAKGGLTTIEKIIYTWAPAKDNNVPERYISVVLERMSFWQAQMQKEVQATIPMKILKIALSAGHHNKDGGSPVEHDITGPLCHYYAEYFRAQGHDVRVITPNDGLGDSTVGLQAVAQQVVDWYNGGWQADLYLETHTQGIGNTAVRGCFGIYPDWGSDIDLGVRNSLANRICQAISQAVGIPVFQAGVMSEKSTAVGIDGDRLGIFLRTATIGQHTTRLIIEHGAHSNPQDLAILKNPDKQKKIAQAAAQAIITYFGDTIMSTNVQSTDPQVVKMNGFNLGHGMLDYWNRVNIPGVQHPLGLPMSEERDWTDPAGKKFVIQVFERGILGYDGSIVDPAYRVQGLIIGPDWAKTHLKAA